MSNPAIVQKVSKFDTLASDPDMPEKFPPSIALLKFQAIDPLSAHQCVAGSRLTWPLIWLFVLVDELAFWNAFCRCFS
jgi:hypothetical protein